VTFAPDTFNCCTRGLAPPSGSAVHNPVTLTVENYTHTNTGPVAYEFSVYTSPDSGDWGYPLAPGPTIVGSVPEATGQTSWTLPVDFPIGVSYWWYARAVDLSNGVKSGPAGDTFRIVASAATVFRFQVLPPPACPPYALSPELLFVNSLDTVGATHMLIQSSDTLTLNLINVGGKLTGTIGGAADGMSFAASPSDSSPAPVTGNLNADGTISGTFDGYVTGRSTYGDPGFCNATSFRWTLSPVESR
jgi:hypothetical protein